jgi:hypothetical protein
MRGNLSGTGAFLYLLRIHLRKKFTAWEKFENFRKVSYIYEG